jgi:hypothetical protein
VLNNNRLTRIRYKIKNKGSKMTFAEKILKFHDNLSKQQFVLPVGFKVINPFAGDQKEQVKKVATAFYEKYYNDTNPRRLILGSSSSRRGSAVTGVPFEDTDHLQNEAGICIGKFGKTKTSSGFLFDVIKEYGGCEKFYSNFCMNFVCPLGIVKINLNGNEVNCNYYDNKELQEVLYPFILNTIQRQIDLGIDTSVCYCIGSGKNYDFLSKINKQYKFFGTIIPLEHPRFIMQYNSKDKEIFIEKYIKALYVQES